jgi:TRAP-type C4-dicarboxylate transport system permease small subunit
MAPHWDFVCQPRFKSLGKVNFLKRIIQHFEEIIGSTLLVAMCAIAMLQAGSRFLSRVSEIKPVYWTEEACTLLFIWLCFVGASYALRTGDHFAVEVLREKLPLKARRIVRDAGLICVAGFCALLIWYGGDLAIRSIHVMTPSLEISRSIAYAAVPAGGFLMLVRTIEILFRRRKEDGEVIIDHGPRTTEQSSDLNPARKETAE